MFDTMYVAISTWVCHPVKYLMTGLLVEEVRVEWEVEVVQVVVVQVALAE